MQPNCVTLLLSCHGGKPLVLWFLWCVRVQMDSETELGRSRGSETPLLYPPLLCHHKLLYVFSLALIGFSSLPSLGCVSEDKWSPALQIRTVLLSIQALLSAPNPDDPLANDVAEQWKTNEVKAIETGECWPPPHTVPHFHHPAYNASYGDPQFPPHY